MESEGSVERATPGVESGFAERVAAFEKVILVETLERARHNQTEAAQLLDLSYHQLRRLTAKHDLRKPASAHP